MEPDPSQPYGHLLFSDPPILPQLLHVSVLFLSRMSLTSSVPGPPHRELCLGACCAIIVVSGGFVGGFGLWESTVSTGTCEHCGGGVAPFSLWGPAWTNLSLGPCPVCMAEGQSDGPVPPCQAQGSVPVLDLLVCEDALAWKCRTTPLQSHCLFRPLPACSTCGVSSSFLCVRGWLLRAVPGAPAAGRGPNLPSALGGGEPQGDAQSSAHTWIPASLLVQGSGLKCSP